MTTLVVIAGAGASHGLGFDDKGPPLIGGWAADLCDRLGAHAGLLELQRDMGPEAFEEKLGAFLRFTRSLSDVAAYPRGGLVDPTQSETPVVQWFEQAKMTCDTIMAGIYGSLHDLFGGSRISPRAAKDAYGPLLSELRAERVVFATTNYDVAGEVAFGELERRPYVGLDATWSPSQAQPLHLDDLLSDDVHRTPVLHLHGCVGWYLGEDGRAIATSADAPYRAELGTPAILLPDPTKAYDDIVSAVIWNHLTVALSQATHVLVLGHSLNDPFLVRALMGVPDSKLGITIYAREGATSTSWQTAEAELTRRLQRRPHVIPIDFRPHPCADHSRMARFLSGSDPEPSVSSSVTRLEGWS